MRRSRHLVQAFDPVCRMRYLSVVLQSTTPTAIACPFRVRVCVGYESAQATAESWRRSWRWSWFWCLDRFAWGLDSHPLRLERVISPSTLELVYHNLFLRIASVPQLVFFEVARDMDWAIASSPFNALLLTRPVRQAIVTTFAQVSAPVRVVPCPSMNRQECPTSVAASSILTRRRSRRFLRVSSPSPLREGALRLNGGRLLHCARKVA